MTQLYSRYFLWCSIGLLALASRAVAQQAPPDSVLRTRPLLLKAGLRLTHLRYARDNQSWQFQLPLSLGAEYRLAPRLSAYTQLEADVQASYTNGRRRATRRNALSAAAVALGVRYYYGRAPQRVPRFGRYLALEGTTEWEQLSALRQLGGRRTTRLTTPSVLTPGVYTLWGVQHRLRGHTFYDLNAGVGVLAPPYYNFERPGTATHWNVGGQANIRLYLGW